MASASVCPPVLLVEDDRLTRVVVRDCLKQCGFSGVLLLSRFWPLDRLLTAQAGRPSLFRVVPRGPLSSDSRQTRVRHERQALDSTRLCSAWLCGCACALKCTKWCCVQWTSLRTVKMPWPSWRKLPSGATAALH